MKNRATKIYITLLGLTVCALSLWIGGLSVVFADGMVGMTCPDYVKGGESFTVEIVATGASAGVDGIQLYLRYNPDLFQLVKANSFLLDTEGTNTTEELSARTLIDRDGTVTLLAYDKPGTPNGNVVARLEFICKADAPAGKTDFSFFDNSFVSVIGSGKVLATSDKLVFEVVNEASAAVPQGEPIQPQPSSTPAPEPALNVPYESDNQIAPVGEVEKDPGAYGVDVQNGAATTPTTTPSSRPTPPSVAQTTPPMETESPLRSNLGEILTVPAGGLPVSAIPNGYQGDTQVEQNVTISVARSADRTLTLYYLKASGEPAFYTKQADGTFKRQEQPQSSQTTQPTQPQKQAFQSEGQSRVLLLIGLSLGALISFSVLLYSLYRNLSKRDW